MISSRGTSLIFHVFISDLNGHLCCVPVHVNELFASTYSPISSAWQFFDTLNVPRWIALKITFPVVIVIENPRLSSA